MKTFQEFVIERDRLLAEADAGKHLRSVLISNMGLEDTINDKTGEDIPLDQLDLDQVAKHLKGSALWKKLSPKAQKGGEDMLREPQNRRLADLLDALSHDPITLGKMTPQDDPPSPVATQGASAPPPSPSV